MMVSQIAGGSGVIQDALGYLGESGDRLLRASELSGWLRPELIGAGGDSFLPTLAGQQQQTSQAAQYASAANAARSNDISAYSAQAQNRLGELNLLAGLRGPSNAIKYNYMLNRLGAPTGTQAQGSYLPTLAPAGNPLSGFAAGATPGQIAASAPKMQPNMGIPNTPAAVAQRPPVAQPGAGQVPQTGAGSGLPAYLLPQGDPQAPAAQERFQQGLQDGSINIQTQEEDVAAHQADLQEAAQQFQEEHGRAPENWETIAQEYENRGYDIPGFAMGTMGGVRDPLALVGDERGGKPELLVNHGDGSFDILNNDTTKRLLDSGMIEKMDMSEYKDGTRKLSMRLGKRMVKGYEDGTSAGRQAPIPGVSERLDWRYMNDSQRQRFMEDAYAAMAMSQGGGAGALVDEAVTYTGNPLVQATRVAGGIKGTLETAPEDLVRRGKKAGMGLLGRVARLGAVPAYADGTGFLVESSLPGLTGATSGFAFGNFASNVSGSPVQGQTTATQGSAPSSNFATGAVPQQGQRSYAPATAPEGALDRTVYDQNVVANLPAIRKLTGQMPIQAAWGTGADTRIPGTSTQLPGMINTRNFMRLAPSEQSLIQSIYETPSEMGGLGVDWADIVAMSQRTTPMGGGLQSMATYGR